MAAPGRHLGAMTDARLGRDAGAAHRQDAAQARHDFPVDPVPPVSRLFLAGLATALAVVGLAGTGGRLPPAPGWQLLPFALAALLALPGLALRRWSITLDRGELVVAATFFTRRVPLEALDLDHARILDLRAHPELGTWTGGRNMDLPGLSAGWYLLRNRRRAFCLLGSRERVLVLPERGGRMLLLGARDPRAMLARLRIARAARGG